MTPALAEQLLIIDRTDADKKEKRLIIQSLNALIESKKVVSVIGDVSFSAMLPASASELEDLFIPRVAGSTFDDVCAPARSALLKMAKSDAFVAIRKKMSYPSDACLCVDQAAGLFAINATQRVKLSVDGDVTGALSEELAMLGEYAALIGGYIYSGDQTSVEQWLRHEKLIVPKTVSDIKNLISFLSFELPQNPALGDYRELLDTDEDSPFHLTESSREHITKVTLEITQGRSSLLHKLAFTNLNVVSLANKREHAEVFIASFLNNKTANALAKAIHQRLRWHLELDNTAVSEQQLTQMATAALLIDMDVQTSPQIVAGYDLYQPANALLEAAQVREKLEQHLVAKALIEEDVAPLAAHLLLASAAPEFLVRQAPAGLTLDKPGWVVIAQTVTLIEQVAPGTSRLMTYPQIKAFSELAPVTLEQDELHALRCHAGGQLGGAQWCD